MDLSLLLPFVIAIALLIIVHEMGHLFAAKIAGIEVQEFGIGFPPRLMRLFKWGETQFTLNWIPFGGFVRPLGETDTVVRGGLAAANPWARLFVYVSGPIMNLLTALILFSFIFLQLGKPDLTRVEIMDVTDNSPAQTAGLEAGDIVLSVNGEMITSSEELRDLIYANLGTSIEIAYLRDEQTFTTSLVPRNPPPAEGAIGIAMGHPLVAISPGQALVVGGQAIYEQISALIALPGRMIRGEVSGEEGRLVGYKGMYDIYTEVREADSAPDNAFPPYVNTLSFFASISVSLGLLNLLPVPALDGGRILFTLPEILFKRRIPQNYENVVNAIGLALLLVLIVYINLQDFLNPIVIP